MLPGLQDAFIGKHALCWLSARLLGYPRDETPLQAGDDCLDDLILDSKYVVQRAVVTLCPYVISGRCVNQLRLDPQLVPASSNTAFNNILHTELSCDSPHVGRFIAILERRVTGYQNIAAKK